MSPGDCFIIGGHGLTPHLWTVLTEPVGDPPAVVIASCTSRKAWTDDTTLLRPGDHPFIVRETVIFYAQLRRVEVRVLEFQRENGAIEPREPFRPDVLRRIVEGALRSPRTPEKFKPLLAPPEEGLE